MRLVLKTTKCLCGFSVNYVAILDNKSSNLSLLNANVKISTKKEMQMSYQKIVTVENRPNIKLLDSS